MGSKQFWDAFDKAGESFRLFADTAGQLLDFEADNLAAQLEAACRYRFRFGHDGARHPGDGPWAVRLANDRN